jgi:TonB family protein
LIAKVLIARGAFACVTASILVSLPVLAEAQGPPSEVRPPQVIHRVDAIYPAPTSNERRHADVVLDVTVDVEGHVTKAEVTESGGADMDEAARAAIVQWTFHPALRAGQPVASRIRVPFHFAPPPDRASLVAPPSVTVATPTAAAVASPNVPPLSSSTAGSSVSPASPVDSNASTTPQTPSSDAQEVNVYGRIAPRAHGTSDYTVQLGELRIIPRANASDALKLAPGFLLTNEGGEGHAEQVFLRGFDAHEGQDLEFTVDGVPINDAGNLHGNGYADTHFIIPELIQSIRVLEGPYAPQQGNFAVAGSADYHLGLEQRGVAARYTVGSFDTQRLLLTWGPKDASTGTFGGAEYYSTNGFGTNRQAQRGSGIGQYETPVGQHGLLRVTAQAYFTEFNSAGVVREDDYESGRVGFYGVEDPNLTGNESGTARHRWDGLLQ